jgi:hypothetical protein
VGEIDAALDEEPEERNRRIRRQVPLRYRCVAAVLLFGAFLSISHAPALLSRLGVSSPAPLAFSVRQ